MNLKLARIIRIVLLVIACIMCVVGVILSSYHSKQLAHNPENIKIEIVGTSKECQKFRFLLFTKILVQVIQLKKWFLYHLHFLL